jgi:hypothetical protein
MKNKMYSVSEARVHLRERGITVSRQALHGLIARHREQCERIGGSQQKAGLWRIPASLLKKYRPSPQHQQAGRAYLACNSPSVLYTQKENA